MHVVGGAAPNFQPAVSGQGIEASGKKSIVVLNDPIFHLVSHGRADDPGNLPPMLGHQRRQHLVKKGDDDLIVSSGAPRVIPDDICATRRPLEFDRNRRFVGTSKQSFN
jgi:hypothetical protein